MHGVAHEFEGGPRRSPNFIDSNVNLKQGDSKTHENLSKKTQYIGWLTGLKSRGLVIRCVWWFLAGLLCQAPNGAVSGTRNFQRILLESYEMYIAAAAWSLAATSGGWSCLSCKTQGYVQKWHVLRWAGRAWWTLPHCGGRGASASSAVPWAVCACPQS